MGLHSFSMFHGDLTRTYTLYVPATYDADKDYPLLFLLHGGGGTGEGMRTLTRRGFETLADTDGFLVVYPDAYENHWNDGRNLAQYRSHKENVDDVGFILAVVDRLAGQYSVDGERVYAAGISNGGMMAQRLACEATDEVAGIAVVASAMSVNLSYSCTPSRQIPVLLISGTEDPLVPFGGGEVGLKGKDYGEVLSTDGTREFWVKNNACAQTPESTMEKDADPSDRTRVRKETNGGCRKNATVVLYVVEGGGHTWPGGSQYLPERVIGKTSEDVDANGVIWDFFSSIARGSQGIPPLHSSAVEEVSVLQEQGGRASWLHAGNFIAFDKENEDGYFDVYIMRPDSSDLRCLTCDAPFVPQLHNGNPSWHPSGRFIVFQAQHPTLATYGITGDYFASPGIGINNNLWVADIESSHFWQLTHVGQNHGTLHPQFSPDGGKLLWSEVADPGGGMGGYWVMRLSDFSAENGVPHLSNVQTLRPLDLQLYETHGFSPDGTRILFSGIEEGKFYYDMEVYVIDLTTGKTVKLTDNDEWDEHAHFTSDGSFIVWTSSKNTPQQKSSSWEDIGAHPPILEYWIMNPDGTNKRQLSRFNDPNAAEYIGYEGGAGLGDFDFSPDGKTIVGKLRRGHGSEMLILVTFTYAGGAVA